MKENTRRALAGLSLVRAGLPLALAGLSLVLAGLLLVPAASAQARADPTGVTLPPELARVLTAYEAAWQKQDAEALAKLFSEDGFVLSQGGPPVRGRDAITKHYTGKGGSLALRALAFQAEGSLGHIIGGYAMRRGEPDAGKFTLTLRQGQASRWLIFSDMDNSNARR